MHQARILNRHRSQSSSLTNVAVYATEVLTQVQSICGKFAGGKPFTKTPYEQWKFGFQGSPVLQLLFNSVRPHSKLAKSVHVSDAGKLDTITGAVKTHRKNTFQDHR